MSLNTRASWREFQWQHPEVSILKGITEEGHGFCGFFSVADWIYWRRFAGKGLPWEQKSSKRKEKFIGLSCFERRLLKKDNSRVLCWGKLCNLQGHVGVQDLQRNSCTGSSKHPPISSRHCKGMQFFPKKWPAQLSNAYNATPNSSSAWKPAASDRGSMLLVSSGTFTFPQSVQSLPCKLM